MAEFTQQQNAPFNAYSWMENDFLNRQASLADQGMQNERFSQEQALKEMQAPTEIAQSGLARMTAERDQRLMPMQEEVATQNIDAEKNFNRLRQMRALMDDDSIDQGQKEQLLRNGLMRSAGISGQPTLQDAQKMARIQYAIDEARNNPDAARKRLDNAMEAYSRTAKSTQQQDLAQTRGNIQHTNTLLRGQIEENKARLRASLGGGDKFSKSWKAYATKQLELANATFGPNSPEAKEWAIQSKEAELAGVQLKAEAQGVRPTVETTPTGLRMGQTPATAVTAPPPAAVRGGGSSPQRANVAVSGDSALVAGALAEIARRQKEQQGNK